MIGYIIRREDRRRMGRILTIEKQGVEPLAWLYALLLFLTISMEKFVKCNKKEKTV